MALWSTLWLCGLALTQGFSAPPNPALQDVLNWVQLVHASRDALGNDALMSMVPYVIVAGDQGVGKSMTINRVVNAQIFPMRSKEKADKDVPQTTIATVYHVRQKQGGTGSSVRVSVTGPTGSLIATKECEAKDVAMDGLALEINRRQERCFQDQFELEGTIVVEYASPNATDISIVDLPGIQHTGEHANRTRALTRNWLEKYTNSIVIAVIVAERQLQQEVVGLLSEQPDKYHDRVVLVVTKPHSIPPESRKVVNLMEDQLALRLSKGRVAVLRSADTSVQEEATWSLQAQQEHEAAYFAEHPTYSVQGGNWGIGPLIELTQEMYLRHACSQIPELGHHLQALNERSVKELRGMRPIASEDALLWDIGFTVQDRLKADMALVGAVSAELASRYSRFSTSEKIDFEWHDRKLAGLPAFGMSMFLPNHAFFQEWSHRAEAFALEVNDILLAGATNVTRAVLQEATVSKSYAFAGSALSALMRCGKGATALNTLRQVVGSWAFATSDYNTEERSQLLKFGTSLNEKVKHSILQTVQHLCIWEPVWNFQEAFREETDAGSLREALLRSINLPGLASKRDLLERRIQVSRSLIENRTFLCPGLPG